MTRTQFQRRWIKLKPEEVGPWLQWWWWWRNQFQVIKVVYQSPEVGPPLELIRVDFAISEYQRGTCRPYDFQLKKLIRKGVFLTAAAATKRRDIYLVTRFYDFLWMLNKICWCVVLRMVVKISTDRARSCWTWRTCQGPNDELFFFNSVMILFFQYVYKILHTCTVV